MKKMILGVMGLGLVLGLAGCQQLAKPAQLPTSAEDAWETGPVAATADPKNATYMIDGQAVTLVNGEAEVPAAPGSATMIKTTIFGEPVAGELTGDSAPDAAVMLVQDKGGSGTFFYQAAALNEAGEYVGTNGILLGDRIAPQTTQVTNGMIIANFAQRAEGEPMSSPPSEMVSKYFKVQGKALIETTQVQGQM